MDGATASHIVFWVILGLSALGVIGGVGAALSLGRSGYKK